MASTPLAEAHQQNDTSFDVFATRKALKDAFDRPNEQSIEVYLDSLDPYRFTTAADPLPLPLDSLRSAEDADAERALGELFTSNSQAHLEQEKYLPASIPGIQPSDFIIEHQYKSEYYGPARDTLRIVLRSDDGIQNSFWPRYAQEIQSRLKAMKLMPFFTRIPHNIFNYDVEILDTGRAFNPLRERLDDLDGNQIVTGVHDAYFAVYYASRSKLQTAVERMLGKDLVDLSLELQKDQRGLRDQIAVVVHVLPQTKFKWYKLRKEIKSSLREPITASMNERTLDIEVEVVPDYHAECLKEHQSRILEGMRKAFPHLVNTIGVAVSDNQSINDLANDNAPKQRKGGGLDSAYATGPGPSPSTPGFADSFDSRGDMQAIARDSLRERRPQTITDRGHPSKNFGSHDHRGRSSMGQIPLTPNSTDHGSSTQSSATQSATAQNPDKPEPTFLPQRVYQPLRQGFDSTFADVQNSSALNRMAPLPTAGCDGMSQQRPQNIKNAVSSGAENLQNTQPIFPNYGANRGLADPNHFPNRHMVEAAPKAAVEVSHPVQNFQSAYTNTSSDDCYISHPDEPPRSNERSLTRSELENFENSASRDAKVPTPNIVSPTDLVTPHDHASQPDVTSNGTVRLPENVFLPPELATSSDKVSRSEYATSNNAALQSESSRWNIFPASTRNTPQAETMAPALPVTAPPDNSNLSASDGGLERFPMIIEIAAPVEVQLDGPAFQDQGPARMETQAPLRPLTPDRPPGRLDWMRSMKRIPRKLRASLSMGNLRDSLSRK